MPMPMMQNYLQQLYDQYMRPAPTPAPTPMTEEEQRAKAMQNYLVQLSRNSPRGKEFAKRQDELRAMVRQAQTTQDPMQRRAIVAAMQNSGMFPTE